MTKVLEFPERHIRTTLAQLCPGQVIRNVLSSQWLAGRSGIGDAVCMWIHGACGLSAQEWADGLSLSSPAGALLIEIPLAGGRGALGLFPHLLVD